MVSTALVSCVLVMHLIDTLESLLGEGVTVATSRGVAKWKQGMLVKTAFSIIVACTKIKSSCIFETFVKIEVRCYIILVTSTCHNA